MPVTRYTYAMPGVPIAENRGGTVKTYTQDLWGSTALLSDTNGGTTDTFQFDFFGNQISRTGSTATSFQFRGGAFTTGSSTRFLFGSRYDTKLGVSLQPPDRAKWDDYCQCRKQCTASAWWREYKSPYVDDCSLKTGRKLELALGSVWAQTCIRCCMNSREFDREKKKMSKPRGASCAKAYFCTRPLSGSAEEIIQISHTLLWIDRNCNGKWDPGEFYGWGGPSDYERDKAVMRELSRRNYGKHYLGPCEMTEDVNTYFQRGLDCLETDCDPACLDLFFKTSVGPGKCWDYTAEKAPLNWNEPKAAGGYCGSPLANPTRNCWAFVGAAMKACGCDIHPGATKFRAGGRGRE